MHSSTTRSLFSTHLHLVWLCWTVARCFDTLNLWNMWKPPTPSMQSLIALIHSYPAIITMSQHQPLLALNTFVVQRQFPVSLADSGFTYWARDIEQAGGWGGWRKGCQIRSVSRGEELEDHKMCFSIQFHHPCSSWKFLLDSDNSLTIDTCSGQVNIYIYFWVFWDFKWKVGREMNQWVFKPHSVVKWNFLSPFILECVGPVNEVFFLFCLFVCLFFAFLPSPLISGNWKYKGN